MSWKNVDFFTVVPKSGQLQAVLETGIMLTNALIYPVDERDHSWENYISTWTMM